MSSPSPRVFLVDDDPFQLHYLGGILRTANYVVEAFELPEVLLARLSANDRGCAVLDLRMPGLDGLALQRSFLDVGILLPLIFVSGHSDVPSAVTAMKQGAVDFLSKPVDAEALLSVCARSIVRDAEAAARRAAREHVRARLAGMSSRERDVCHLYAQGLLNKQIAATLDLTESTVQAHRARALQKLQVSTVAELVHLLAQANETD
ncbi:MULTISPECIES: response regulator transcription factor [Myxococcus]|uniref:response regulator transcription factor n=1 Tax=Myxococcus TaxID=32 RepID=UPI0013D796A3|nr:MULTISPECIES: response regulator [Myxococcus]NVJ27215.1 response regulator transcription factor [Myxococcus sp. AM011]